MTDAERIALLLSMIDADLIGLPLLLFIRENTFPALHICEMQTCCLHKISRFVISSTLDTRYVDLLVLLLSKLHMQTH
jgi:hypothetical protein